MQKFQHAHWLITLINPSAESWNSVQKAVETKLIDSSNSRKYNKTEWRTGEEKVMF